MSDEAPVAAPAPAPTTAPAPTPAATPTAPATASPFVSKEATFASPIAKPKAEKETDAGSITAKADPAPALVKKAEPAPKPEAKAETKAGYDHVDFSSLSQEQRGVIEPRFNRLYGQVKAQDRRIADLDSMNAQLAERLSQVVKEVETSSLREKMSVLSWQAEQAAQQGNYQEALRLSREIGKLETQGVQAPPPIAPTNPAFDAQEEATILAWSKQRPWCQKDSPHQRLAAQVGGEIFDNPHFAQRTIEEKLAEIDRVMASYLNTGQAPQQQPQRPAAPPHQAVLGNNQSIRPAAPQNDSKLTEDQKRVARNMFRPRTPQEINQAYARYAKQIELTR